MDARLAALQNAVRSLGMVAVTNPDGFDVRLSTFEKIRVSLKDGALDLQPYLGLVPRVRATLMSITLSALVIPFFFFNDGITPTTMSLAFLLLLSTVYLGIRYTTTESCIARIQMAWLSLPASVDSGATSDRASIGEGQMGAARSYSEPEFHRTSR